MGAEREIVWNCLKEESEDSVTELCLCLGCWLDSVNNMHFEVHELTIDRVLRRCMEMVLKTMQIAAVNVLLE